MLFYICHIKSLGQNFLDLTKITHIKISPLSKIFIFIDQFIFYNSIVIKLAYAIHVTYSNMIIKLS
jgi:hypothetical protein